MCVHFNSVLNFTKVAAELPSTEGKEALKGEGEEGEEEEEEGESEREATCQTGSQSRGARYQGAAPLQVARVQHTRAWARRRICWNWCRWRRRRRRRRRRRQRRIWVWYGDGGSGWFGFRGRPSPRTRSQRVCARFQPVRSLGASLYAYTIHRIHKPNSINFFLLFSHDTTSSLRNFSTRPSHSIRTLAYPTDHNEPSMTKASRNDGASSITSLRGASGSRAPTRGRTRTKRARSASPSPSSSDSDSSTTSATSSSSWWVSSSSEVSLVIGDW